MSGIVDQIDDVLSQRDAAYEQCLNAPDGSQEAMAAAAEWERLQARLWDLLPQATSEEQMAALLRRGPE